MAEKIELTGVPETMLQTLYARTLVLDRMISEWLSENPGAAVVNIACGLDTRCYRMSGYAHWYNLDLPETIAVRRRLLPESGTISQIAMSAMDDWGGEIAEHGVPTLVVIEGLSMYLSEAAALLAGVFGNVPFINAFSCAWIAFGNLWMFLGLLLAVGRK